jgi:DHA2 family multidrug resistance protein
MTAWMMMPAAVVIGILSVVAGRLSDYIAPKILIIFGLGAVALCLFQYTTISALTSTAMITVLLAARGIARAFTIAPLSAASLRPLPESQVRMGTGLLSLTRGIAASCSVALAATLLQNRLAARSVLLAQDQTALPLGQEALLEQLNVTFQRLGDISQIASMKSLAMLNQLINTEAALHSYHDMFILIGCVSALGILPALWMGSKRKQISEV